MNATTIITTQWADEAKTVIHVRCGRDWSYHDFMENDRRVTEMMDSIDYPVDYILDVRGAPPPPGIISHFPEMARTAAGVNHPRACRVVLVGLDSYMHVVREIFSKMYPKEYSKMLQANTLEEALELLQSARAGSSG